MSNAVIPSPLAKPTLVRDRMRPGAADEVLFFAADTHHHRRVELFGSKAGITMVRPPVILLPKPPPVYSLMKTILSSSVLIIQHTIACFENVLCVPVQRKSLPFSQRAMVVPRLPRIGDFYVGSQEGLFKHQSRTF